MMDWVQAISYLLTNELRLFLGLYLVAKLMDFPLERKALLLTGAGGCLATILQAASLPTIGVMVTMAVGVIWLFSIMSMSLLRFRPIQYLYLFIRFAGVDSSIWILNKLVLLVAGIVLWICVFLVCQKRLWVQ